jgi:hypothetical protein
VRDRVASGFEVRRNRGTVEPWSRGAVRGSSSQPGRGFVFHAALRCPTRTSLPSPSLAPALGVDTVGNQATR